MSDDKKYPVVSKDVLDNIFTSENGWTTLYEGPTLKMTKTEVLDNPLKQVSVDGTIPDRTFVPDFPVICGSKGCQIDPNKDYQVRVPDFHKLEGVREIIRQTEEAGGYRKEFSESLVTEEDGLVGVDSIRAGIDAEILNKLSNAGIDVLKEVQEAASQFMAQALAEEEAAIVDDLKRQMEAKIPQLLDEATHCPKCGADTYISPRVISCSKCTWFYIPLQVSHIFKKEEGDK